MKALALVMLLALATGVAAEYTDTSTGITYSGSAPDSTLAITTASGEINMGLLMGVAVGLAIIYIIFYTRSRKRLQLAFVIVALYLAALYGGVLAATGSHPLWQDNYVDCTGMNEEQMQKAALGASDCKYGAVKDVTCNSAKTYYRRSGGSSSPTEIWSPGGGTCGASKDCTSSSNPICDPGCTGSDKNNNYCRCGHMGTSTNVNYQSVGTKRRLTWNCLDSLDRNNNVKCTSASDCQPIDGIPQKCNTATGYCYIDQITGTGLWKKYSSSCSSYTDCKNTVDKACSPKLASAAVCINSAGKQSSWCPACKSSPQLGFGCWGYCSSGIIVTCQQKACPDGYECQSDGKCLKIVNAAPSFVTTDGCAALCEGAGYNYSRVLEDGNCACSLYSPVPSTITSGSDPLLGDTIGDSLYLVGTTTPYCGDKDCALDASGDMETCSSCSSDCGQCSVSDCNNNGVCDSKESTSTCPNDCPEQTIFDWSKLEPVGYLVLLMIGLLVLIFILKLLFRKKPTATVVA